MTPNCQIVCPSCEMWWLFDSVYSQHLLTVSRQCWEHLATRAKIANLSHGRDVRAWSFIRPKKSSICKIITMREFLLMSPFRVNSYKQHYWYLQSLKADKKATINTKIDWNCDSNKDKCSHKCRLPLQYFKTGLFFKTVDKPEDLTTVT